MRTDRCVPIAHFRPKWVEFTDTKGVLRCLQPDEDQNRAKGMIFLCPTCKPDKEKQHYNIFLFPDAPVDAKPHGRFVLSPVDHKKKLSETENFNDTRLVELLAHGHTTIITPRDVCGWKGMLFHGKVYF